MLILSLAFEFIILLSVGFFLVLWRWRALKKKLRELESHWHAIGDAIETDIAALAIQRVTSDPRVKYKISNGKSHHENDNDNDEDDIDLEDDDALEYQQSIRKLTTELKIKSLKGMMEMFGKSLQHGVKSWVQTRDAIFRVIHQLEDETDRSTKQSHQLDLEIDHLRTSIDAKLDAKTTHKTNHVTPRQRDTNHDTNHVGAALVDPGHVPEDEDEYADVLSNLHSRNTNLTALHDYKDDLSKLGARFHDVSATNQKLLEQIDLLSEKNSEIVVFRQMSEAARQQSDQLELMVTDLEHKRAKLEPKIAHLDKENQQLLASLNYYRQRIKDLSQQNSAIIQERIHLKELLDRMEMKIALRTRTYWRLRKKFDALRHEYITLYDAAKTLSNTHLNE